MLVSMMMIDVKQGMLVLMEHLPTQIIEIIGKAMKNGARQE
jgi:hypothetical protein